MSSSFEFDKFSKHPNFGIANSLFTHLTPDAIELCLGNLRAVVDDCRFFVSFKEVDAAVRNPWHSADYRGFSYTPRADGRVRCTHGVGCEPRR